MKEDSNNSKITIFDTTMRDGELMSGFKMNLQQKLSLALLLEEMRVDVIEVGYPGNFAKDFEEISINGVGARKGNADLGEIVRKIALNPNYQTNIKIDLLDEVSELVKNNCNS